MINYTYKNMFGIVLATEMILEMKSGGSESESSTLYKEEYGCPQHRVSAVFNHGHKMAVPSTRTNTYEHCLLAYILEFYSMLMYTNTSTFFKSIITRFWLKVLTKRNSQRGKESLAASPGSFSRSYCHRMGAVEVSDKGTVKNELQVAA